VRIEFARWRANPLIQNLSVFCYLVSSVARSVIFEAVLAPEIYARVVMVLEALVSQRTLLASGSPIQPKTDASTSLYAMEVPLWVSCAAFGGG
jgi:hypothetical protein